MNKNIDVLAVILVLAGFACVSLVQRWQAECLQTRLAAVTASQVQTVLVNFRLPKLCLTRE